MRRSDGGPQALFCVGIAAVGIASPLFAQVAEASCVTGDATLLWSHPPDGATDVPTNTTVWMLPSPPRSLLLNGVAVTSTDGRVFKPEGLLPNTVYRAEATFRSVTAVTLRFSFTTGAGPREVGRLNTPRATSGMLDARPSLSPACGEILNAGDCLDTNGYGYLQFTVAERPLFWLIRSLPASTGLMSSGGNVPFERPWPAACGDPHIYEFGQRDDCHVLVAFNERGESATSDPICRQGGQSGADGGVATAAPSANCAYVPGSGRSPMAPFFVVALAFVVQRRRRRRDEPPDLHVTT